MRYSINLAYALNIADDGRVLSVTYAKYAPADAVMVEELPEGNITDYRYVDGEFVHDPLPKPVPPSAPSEVSVWDELDAAYQEGVDSI